jgi:hypothetical protein
MASSTPATPIARRTFSLPSLPSARLASSPDPQIEVLFTLPSVRIIAFTTPTSTSTSASSSTSRPSSSNGNYVVEEAPGTLPWVSRFERTIAVGM